MSDHSDHHQPHEAEPPSPYFSAEQLGHKAPLPKTTAQAKEWAAVLPALNLPPGLRHSIIHTVTSVAAAPLPPQGPALPAGAAAPAATPPRHTGPRASLSLGGAAAAGAGGVVQAMAGGAAAAAAAASGIGGGSGVSTAVIHPRSASIAAIASAAAAASSSGAGSSGSSSGAGTVSGASFVLGAHSVLAPANASASASASASSRDAASHALAIHLLQAHGGGGGSGGGAGAPAAGGSTRMSLSLAQAQSQAQATAPGGGLAPLPPTSRAAPSLLTQIAQPAPRPLLVYASSLQDDGADGGEDHPGGGNGGTPHDHGGGSADRDRDAGTHVPHTTSVSSSSSGYERHSESQTVTATMHVVGGRASAAVTFAAVAAASQQQQATAGAGAAGAPRPPRLSTLLGSRSASGTLSAVIDPSSFCLVHPGPSPSPGPSPLPPPPVSAGHPTMPHASSAGAPQPQQPHPAMAMAQPHTGMRRVESKGDLSGSVTSGGVGDRSATATPILRPSSASGHSSSRGTGGGIPVQYVQPKRPAVASAATHMALQEGENQTYVIREDTAVPMRDGVILYGDLYIPARAGVVDDMMRYPVVLIRTPYNKSVVNPDMRHPGQYWTSSGYCLFIQDCRGRFKSGGDFYKYTGEAADGYDTVEWIAAQDWCNGDVCTDGPSYLCHVQTSMALLRPPHLTAMFCNKGGFWNAHTSGVRSNGAYEARQWVWAIKNADRKNPITRAALNDVNMAQWLHRYPFKRGDSPLSDSPEYEQYIFDQVENDAYGDYWKMVGLNTEEHVSEFADSPAAFLSGWYDIYARIAVDFYTHVSKLPGRQSSTCLIMGSWQHTGGDDHVAGEVDFGTNALISGNLAQGQNAIALSRDWFDRFVSPASRSWFAPVFPREDDTANRGPGPYPYKLPENKRRGTRGSALPPNVRYFRMGSGDGHKTLHGKMYHGGVWYASDCWPPRGVQYINFYLQQRTLKPCIYDSPSPAAAAAHAEPAAPNAPPCVVCNPPPRILSFFARPPAPNPIVPVSPPHGVAPGIGVSTPPHARIHPALLTSTSPHSAHVHAHSVSLTGSTPTLRPVAATPPPSMPPHSLSTGPGAGERASGTLRSPPPLLHLCSVHRREREREQLFDRSAAASAELPVAPTGVVPATIAVSRALLDVAAQQQPAAGGAAGAGPSVHSHVPGSRSMHDLAAVLNAAHAAGGAPHAPHQPSSRALLERRPSLERKASSVGAVGAGADGKAGAPPLERRNSVTKLDAAAAAAAANAPVPGVFVLPSPGNHQSTFPAAGEPLRVPLTGVNCSSYQFDPTDPCPTLGGNIFPYKKVLISGAHNQIEMATHFLTQKGNAAMPLSSRRDVVVFRTEPLTADLDVTGMPVAVLYVSSSCVDTDFTVKLIDEYPRSADYPSGFALNVTHGIVRCRYRNSRSKAELMERDRAYECVIELYPTSNLFKAGHRVRLDVSSSNYPHFDINPNTGENYSKSQRILTADNFVLHHRIYPSRLLLPVLFHTSGDNVDADPDDPDAAYLAADGQPPAVTPVPPSAS